MTTQSLTTPQSGKGVVVRTVFTDRTGTRLKAEALQRKGMTLSEIAEELDCRRESIAHLLYWEKVRS